MPASAEVTNAISSDAFEVSAQTNIGGNTYDWITCIGVELSAGAVPARARIKLGGSNYDVPSPVTLNAYNWPFGPGSRVKISLAGDSNNIFLGQLGKRNDEGGEDALLWTAYDDRVLLMQIPLDGCLVLDSYDNTVKYISRFSCHFNPKGDWNCVGGLIGGNVYPVFTSQAQIGKTYEAPDETFSDQLTVNKLTAWTPRRVLQYCQLLANLVPGDVPGIDSRFWRSIKKSKRIQWNVDSLAITGKDAVQKFDPLDRKYPDHKVQGQRMLTVITDALSVAGTHGLTLMYGTDASVVTFYPEKVFNKPKDTTVIPLQRGGNAFGSDINTGFDFSLEEDSTQIAESVVVKGQPVRTESPWICNWTKTQNATATAPAVVDPGTSPLQPAWTYPEFSAFLYCCFGNPAITSGTKYAWYPRLQNGTTPGDRLYANGKAGQPLALAGTQQAISLARKCFPRVLIAFKIDSNMAQANSPAMLQGFDNRYATAALLLGGARPMLPHQLQYYLLDPNSTDTPTNRIRTHFPIRISVQDAVTTVWHDCPHNDGCRLEEDGFIYIDGLAENFEPGGSVDALYSGSLAANAMAVLPRVVKINMAVPLDVRVAGYAEVDKGTGSLDPSLFSDLGGPFMMYVDSLESYQEHHQVQSEPSPTVAYYGGSDGNAQIGAGAGFAVGAGVPLSGGGMTRLVPPGSEQPHADYAASRKLAGARYPQRRSSWKMVGIRPEFYIGQWIDKVKIIQGTAGDSDYDLNSPLRNISLDFMNQITTLGGLLSQFTGNMASNKAPKSLKKSDKPDVTYKAPDPAAREARIAAAAKTAPQDE